MTFTMLERQDDVTFTGVLHDCKPETRLSENGTLLVRIKDCTHQFHFSKNEVGEYVFFTRDRSRVMVDAMRYVCQLGFSPMRVHIKSSDGCPKEFLITEKTPFQVIALEWEKICN